MTTDGVELLAIALAEKIMTVSTAKSLDRIRQRGERQVAGQFAKQGVVFLRNFEHSRGAMREATAPVPPGFEESWAAAERTTGKEFAAAIERMAKLAIVSGLRAAEQMMLPGLSPISLSLKNPRAVNYLRQYGARQIAGINETTRNLIRNLLAEGIARGDSYQKIARAIREKFEEFRSKRSKLVAVTEIGNAYEEGNLIVARDMAERGVAMEKSWQTAGDEKVEEQCAANEGAGWIGLDDQFPGGADRPLQHPRCRCTALYRRKPSKEQEKAA